MKHSKKLLSLFLAVVMLFSVFTVVASAYTRVAEAVAGNINIKYSVETVDTVPATDAGSEEYTADNIYAVHVWLQCDEAVDVLTAPLHYNKAHFSPIMLVADGATYPQGAGLNQDTYFTDMGEGALYAYSLGDYMNNTGMYKADGSTATTKALAKCIGLGNANSAGVGVISELVSPDHTLYSKWGAGLPENTGVMYVNLDVSSKTKTAYLNTISGIEADTGWNKMFTFYFELVTGVTADDVIGDEFGVYTDDCFTVDGTTDEYAGYFTAATTVVPGNPTKNVVANAVVEEQSPVYAKGSQVRFNGTEANGTGSASFDIRTRAAMSAADFAAICGEDSVAEGAITDVGFVYAASTVTFDLATAKAVATGTAADGYTKKSVSYIQNTGTEYVWTCLITGADYEGAVNSLAYITVNGTTYYFNAAYATDFSTLYDTWYDDYTASLS